MLPSFYPTLVRLSLARARKCENARLPGLVDYENQALLRSLVRDAKHKTMYRIKIDSLEQERAVLAELEKQIVRDNDAGVACASHVASLSLCLSFFLLMARSLALPPPLFLPLPPMPHLPSLLPIRAF